MKKIILALMMSITLLFGGCGNDKKIIEDTIYISRYKENIGPLFRELEYVSHSANLINRYGYNEMMSYDKLSLNKSVFDLYSNHDGITRYISYLLQNEYRRQLTQGNYPDDINSFQVNKENEKWEIKEYTPSKEDKYDPWFTFKEESSTSVDKPNLLNEIKGRDKFYTVIMSNDLITAEIIVKKEENDKILLNYNASKVTFKTGDLKDKVIKMSSNEYFGHIITSISFDLAYKMYTKVYSLTDSNELEKRLQELFADSIYVNPYYVYDPAEYN